MPTFSFSSSSETIVGSQPLPSKKTRDRKKTSRPASVVVQEQVQQPEPEPEQEQEPEQEPEEERYEKESYEPTFPNIVILKQNDHNYIVKHNHYPITSSHSTAGPDLVSPNQIHKGQINKKRGRKPKAGFIMNSNSGIYDTSEVPNIILHLKCHLSDLKTNESISNYEYTPAIGEVESYTLATSNYLQSSDICQPKNIVDLDNDDECSDDSDGHCVNDNIGNRNIYGDTGDADTTHTVYATSSTTAAANHDTECVDKKDPLKPSNCSKTSVVKKVNDSAIQVLNERSQKEIMKKINRLKYSFHNGETIQTKINDKSACFWDTCEFDGPIYYIPIMIVNGIFQVNGCYCSPECAVAALLKEPLDTSTKFERLHLLHLLYGTPSGKGFKPAPNPNYLLDKYYGNLTIQEYRALLKGPQMIHIVNKPLTHILPELYEDNNDFLVNSKVIPTNSLKMKKRYKTMVVQGGAE